MKRLPPYKAIPHDLRLWINLSAPSPLSLSGESHETLTTDRILGTHDWMANLNSQDHWEAGVEDPADAGSNRFSELFLLKKVLLEKSGDNSDLAILAMSVHAVMLDSGFVLLNPASDKFCFSHEHEFFPVCFTYTLPELITSKDTNTITVNFQILFYYMVIVSGMLGVSSPQGVAQLDKRWVLPVIDLLIKSDKQAYSSIYPEVFTFWRMVKDHLVTPLLIGLRHKAGLELPPCFMRLPTELKLKILESLPGVSIAKMACLCTELCCLASDNDLWKKKFFEEFQNANAVNQSRDSVNWKAKFAIFWRQHEFERLFYLPYRWLQRAPDGQSPIMS